MTDNAKFKAEIDKIPEGGESRIHHAFIPRQNNASGNDEVFEIQVLRLRAGQDRLGVQYKLQYTRYGSNGESPDLPQLTSALRSQFPREVPFLTSGMPYTSQRGYGMQTADDVVAHIRFLRERFGVHIFFDEADFRAAAGSLDLDGMRQSRIGGLTHEESTLIRALDDLAAGASTKRYAVFVDPSVTASDQSSVLEVEVFRTREGIFKLQYTAAGSSGKTPETLDLKPEIRRALPHNTFLTAGKTAQMRQPIDVIEHIRMLRDAFKIRIALS